MLETVSPKPAAPPYSVAPLLQMERHMTWNYIIVIHLFQYLQFFPNAPFCIQRHKNQFFFRYIIIPTGENQAKKIAGKTSAATTWKATHHYGLHEGERKHLFLSFFCREIVCVRVLARRKKFAPSSCEPTSVYIHG